MQVAPGNRGTCASPPGLARRKHSRLRQLVQLLAEKEENWAVGGEFNWPSRTADRRFIFFVLPQVFPEYWLGVRILARVGPCLSRWRPGPRDDAGASVPLDPPKRGLSTACSTLRGGP